MVNHKWNILKAMRFYNRIGKEFNAETYGKFYLAKFDESKILLEIRQHRRCGRVELKNKNLVLTDKGYTDLRTWEMEQSTDAEERKLKHAIARGHSRPNVRTQDGRYFA